MSTGSDANDNHRTKKPVRGDADQSNALINRLRDEQVTTPQENRSWLNQAVHSAVGAFVQNESATRNQREQYAVDFIKAVPLFVGGGWGKAFSAVAFGADEVKCNDSPSMQAWQLASGAAKGFLTKTAFDYLGARNFNFAAKGMAMGGSSRFLDTALTPSNYFDTNGNVDLSRTIEKGVHNAGDLSALGIDVMTFGAAHLAPGAFTRTALQRSTALTTSLTGASFGFTSGTLSELQRQWHNGESTDLIGAVQKGGIEAGLMAAAAVTGHVFTPGARAKAADTPVEERGRPAHTTDGAEPSGLPPAGTGSSPLAGAEAAPGAIPSPNDKPALGLTTLDALERSAPLYLIKPKGSQTWSLSTTGPVRTATEADAPANTSSGEPLRESKLSIESLNSILGREQKIHPRVTRISVTRRQVDKINRSVSPDEQLTTVKRESADAVLSEHLDKLLGRYPDKSDVKKFETLANSLSYKLKKHYVRELQFAVNSNVSIKGPEVNAKMTSLLFEMSRMRRALQQGLETVSDRPLKTQAITYFGYNDLPRGKSSDFSARPVDVLSSEIEIDVPIIRENGKPYVHEVKTLTGMQFGLNRSHRNQVLKYQSAIDQSFIDGATIEVSGRVNPKALQWLTGTRVGDRGAAPDVEVLYTMPLPSGVDYTFVLKRADHNRGLRFFNDDRTYTDEDRRIVAGIYRAIQDGSITQLISDTHIEDPKLRRLIRDPIYIRSVDLLHRYNEERQKNLNRKLMEKAAGGSANRDQPRDAISEYNSRSYIEEATRAYQDHLQQKPDSSRSKQTFLLGSEQAVQNAVDRAHLRAQEIRAYEIARADSADEAKHRTERTKLGYVGRPEGFALDLDHMILDGIQEENKTAGRRGRRYAQPERFMDVGQLQDYLSGQDRTTTNIRIFDPVTKTETVQSQIPLSQVKQILRSIDAQNLERAKQTVEQNDQRYEELRAQPRKSIKGQDKIELRRLSMLPRFSSNKSRSMLEPAEQELRQLTSERKQSAQSAGQALRNVPTDERTAHVEAMKRQLEVSDTAIDESRARLREVYTHILGGGIAWAKVAKAVSTQDNNIAKFRYVVTPEGAMPVARAGLQGEIPADASFSELARGRNVYGAGELVFMRDAANGRWRLSEINNAGTQYSVPADATLEYVRNLVQKAGIDTSQADLFDALRRGTRLRDQHLFPSGYASDAGHAYPNPTIVRTM